MSVTIFIRSTVFLAATGILTASAPYLLTAKGMLNGSAVVTTMARSQVTVGDRFAAAGEWGAAVQSYEIAADLVRAQGKLPVEEMRRVANAQFYNGYYRDAAATLELLANEAADYGDRLAEFWAVTDAARLAELAGAYGFARWYALRAERLLGSEELAEFQEEVRAKLASSNLTVFAPHLGSW